MSDDKVVSLGAAKKIKKEHEECVEHEENGQGEEPVYCSFCNRPNTEVVKMVQGPGVNICSECTMIAVQYLILNDRMPSAEAQMILDAFWGKCRR
ncbi:ClpX C4-type zinc finger protein [bacterium]|nr:ClpX C4-type zinc finger protein [bacterium]